MGKITSVSLSEKAAKILEDWRGRRSKYVSDLVEQRKPIRKLYRFDQGAFLGEEYTDAPEEGVVLVEYCGVLVEFSVTPDFSNSEAWYLIKTGLELL
jgi:hypothetical protein